MDTESRGQLISKTGSYCPTDTLLKMIKRWEITTWEEFTSSQSKRKDFFELNIVESGTDVVEYV